MSTITVKIDGEERSLASAAEPWINQQINRRRADGAKVCVLVRILGHELDLFLMTPTCPRGVGIGRQLTERERGIAELWKERGLDTPEFTGGNLVAFLKQLRKLIS